MSLTWRQLWLQSGRINSFWGKWRGSLLRLIHLSRSLEGGGKEVAVKCLIDEISRLRPDWEQIPVTTFPAPAHLGFYTFSPNVIRKIRSFSVQATKEHPLVFNAHGYGEFHADVVAFFRRIYSLLF